MYTVSPNQTECFCLRLLLNHVRGPKSFKEVKYFDGTQYNTFKEACLARGLLENDDHLRFCIQESIISKLPCQVRSLFGLILVYCNPSNPVGLYEEFKSQMSLDILNQMTENQNEEIDNIEIVYSELLHRLESIINEIGDKSLRDVGLPEPMFDQFNGQINSDPNTVDETTNFIERNEIMLNVDQREVYDKIIDCLNGLNNTKLKFLDAPGGTGKTFLLNLILAKNKVINGKSISVASSGIASTLLDEGKTVHSMFKLPFSSSISDEFTTSIRKNSKLWNYIKNCDLIIWDEAAMSHRNMLEAVNKTFKEIKNSNDPFGNVTVLLAGDFRQILPVVPRGTKADEIDASIKSSQLWNLFEKLSLRINMRVNSLNSTDLQYFANKLVEIGEDKINSCDNRIALQFGNRVSTIVALMESVFDNFESNYTDMDYLSERAILATINDNVHSINNEMLEKISEPIYTYNSIDKAIDTNEEVNFPIEFINSLEISGMPPHCLKLKIGAPNILLRNLNSPKLCNGTRMVVISLSNNVIEAKILNGKYKGEQVLLPRIKLINEEPIKFSRLQFPVRLSYALTINKSQVQTFKKVGLNLTNEVFTHGQLHVAVSRIGDPRNLYYYQEEEKTKI
ncbi:ATP-dependent DNA helicase Pif1-like [Oratosquilla oratoria]|uniref:ATP-dependent DNA helicase Pif1-like n=1 Tax=Oratosquilla oratoria TaxID=337810 RepID=UPI003F7590C0